MALLHRATIVPSKPEMLAAWVPRQPWYAGSGGDLTVLGAYRFDDPAGEVGIETFLVRSGAGPVLHVPVTYRAAPLAGAEAALVTEMQHSALGPRWVHDATADPVYAAVLLEAMLTGGREATQEIEVDGVLQTRETATFATGSGVPGTPVPDVGTLTRHETDGGTVVVAGGHEITVVRRVVPAVEVDVVGAHTLVGRWSDHSEPTLLAVARRAGG